MKNYLTQMESERSLTASTVGVVPVLLNLKEGASNITLLMVQYMQMDTTQTHTYKNTALRRWFRRCQMVRQPA